MNEMDPTGHHQSLASLLKSLFEDQSDDDKALKVSQIDDQMDYYVPQFDFDDILDN